MHQGTTPGPPGAHIPELTLHTGFLLTVQVRLPPKLQQVRNYSQQGCSCGRAAANYLLVVEANVMVANNYLQLHVAWVSEHLPKPLHVICPGLWDKMVAVRPREPPLLRGSPF